MLDTNVLSDILRRLGGSVARQAAAVEPGGVAISTIVAAELRYGAERRGSARLTRQLEAVLSAVNTLPLEPPADRHYATIEFVAALFAPLVGEIGSRPVDVLGDIGQTLLGVEDIDDLACRSSAVDMRHPRDD